MVFKYDISDTYPKELTDIVTKNPIYTNSRYFNSYLTDRWLKINLNDNTNVFKTKHGAEHFRAQLLELINQKIEVVDHARDNLKQGSLRLSDGRYNTYLFDRIYVDSEDEVKSILDQEEEYLYDLKRNDPFIIEEREFIISDWKQA